MVASKDVLSPLQYQKIGRMSQSSLLTCSWVPDLHLICHEDSLNNENPAVSHSFQHTSHLCILELVKGSFQLALSQLIHAILTEHKFQRRSQPCQLANPSFLEKLSFKKGLSLKGK